MAESRLGEALSCPQGLGLNGPIGPFKPSSAILLRMDHIYNQIYIIYKVDNQIYIIYKVDNLILI